MEISEDLIVDSLNHMERRYGRLIVWVFLKTKLGVSFPVVMLPTQKSLCWFMMPLIYYSYSVILIVLNPPNASNILYLPHRHHICFLIKGCTEILAATSCRDWLDNSPSKFVMRDLKCWHHIRKNEKLVDDEWIPGCNEGKLKWREWCKGKGG